MAIFDEFAEGLLRTQAVGKGTEQVAAHCILNKQTCSTSSYTAGQQTQQKAEKNV